VEIVKLMLWENDDNFDVHHVQRPKRVIIYRNLERTGK
jgi:hypothetical protein